MRHLHGYRKLGKPSAHRKAMLRNLATSFLENEHLKTTLPRAKELRKLVERLITKGKKGGLHHRRMVDSYLFKTDVTKKVFSDIAVRFKDRNGGYTRIVKYGPRFGDGAEMCSIELVDYREKLAASLEDAPQEEKA